MKKIIIPVLISSSIFLGMASPLKINPAAGISHSIHHLLKEESGVRVWVKNLSSEESEHYVKKDLLSLGVQPVEIIIDNASPDPYYFSPRSIDLPLVEERDILKKVFSSAFPRQLGFQVASLFFWPFMFPSTIDSLLTHKSYRKLAKEFSSKSVKEESIAPYSTVHRIFFLVKDHKTEQFCVTLENEETLESKVFEGAALSLEEQGLALVPTPVENYYLTHEG